MKIDQRILNDSEFIKDLNLCQLRLYKDGDLDWFVLIPRVESIIEVIDLSVAQQQVLWQEVAWVSEKLRLYSQPDKINIGALGNMVPQLHIHIIARKKSDRAWPGAVWGTKSKKNFQAYQVDDWKLRLK